MQAPTSQFENMSPPTPQMMDLTQSIPQQEVSQQFATPPAQIQEPPLPQRQMGPISAGGPVSNYTPMSPMSNYPPQPYMYNMPSRRMAGESLASSFKVGNAALIGIAITTGFTLGISAYTLAQVNKSNTDMMPLSGGALTGIRLVQGLTIAVSSIAFAGSIALLVLKLKYKV